MEEENRDLRQFILSHIKETGPIPFSQFMAWCLYHPVHGYSFFRGRQDWGWRGTIISSPSVHPLFGRLVAKQLAQMADLLGRGVFDVVEMGGRKRLPVQGYPGLAQKLQQSVLWPSSVHSHGKKPAFRRGTERATLFYEKEGKSSGRIQKHSRDRRPSWKVVTSPTN